jgi:hypothetical protein
MMEHVSFFLYFGKVWFRFLQCWAFSKLATEVDLSETPSQWAPIPSNPNTAPEIPTGKYDGMVDVFGIGATCLERTRSLVHGVSRKVPRRMEHGTTKKTLSCASDLFWSKFAQNSSKFNGTHYGTLW